MVYGNLFYWNAVIVSKFRVSFPRCPIQLSHWYKLSCFDYFYNYEKVVKFRFIYCSNNSIWIFFSEIGIIEIFFVYTVVWIVANFTSIYLKKVIAHFVDLWKCYKMSYISSHIGVLLYKTCKKMVAVILRKIGINSHHSTINA